MKPGIAIVGAGKVGSALAVALQRAGYPIAGIASRSLKSAKELGRRLGVSYSDFPAAIAAGAKIVFITTPDREIANAAQIIAGSGGFNKEQVVVHTSGLLPASAIDVAKKYGAAIAAFHPLQSFADVETAVSNLPGSYFSMQGDPAALEILQQITEDLQGSSFIIKEQDKPLFHAAATVTSNYLVAVIHLAAGLFGKLGVEREQSVQALFPLIQGTLNNIESAGTVQALTGPVERGDAATLQSHMAALSKLGPAERQAYKILGCITVDIALQKGSINMETASELVKILEDNNGE